MPISENIKALRALHNLSQRDLAEIAGVTDKAVSTWETGAYSPRMGAIRRMADYFGIPKSAIVDENGICRAVPEGCILDFSGLPSEGQRELLEYFEYLKRKYGDEC